MKQQTAVEWLEEQMKTWGDKPRWMRDDIVEAAKEIEKIQITHAHKTASLEAGFEHSADDWAEQYYTNTYGQ
jgi:hypothetical protein